MLTEENKKVALTVIDAFNARDLSRWSQQLADDYAAECPDVPVLNKTRSIGYNQRFVTAFPDLRFEVHRVLAEGDHVLTHWTASGTHAERLATVTGETIPPTRRRATVSGALLTEVRDGEIARILVLGSTLAPGPVGRNGSPRALLESRGLLRFRRTPLPGSSLNKR